VPKPSLDPAKARQGGTGPESGAYEVLSAKFTNLKSDYKATSLTLVLHSALLDKDGDRVRGADEVDINLSFGEKSLEAFQPALVSGPLDPDPEPKGTEADAEGNSIYCEEGAEINGSCGATVFNTSLVKLGFPKDTLDQCYAPNYVGLKFFLETLPSKDCNERFGTRLNTKPMTGKDGVERPITYKVATKWLNPNYLAAGNSGPKSTKKADAPAQTGASAEQLAKDGLARVAASKSGKAIKTMQALTGFFTSEYSSAKMPPGQLAAAQRFVKDEAWVKAYLTDELGASLNDDGSVLFP
jgi:hypothetical protein